MILGTDLNRRRLGGFTLVEVMVANVLMGLLVALIAGAWRATGPICVEVIARSRIASEANVAAAAFYSDTQNHGPSRNIPTNGTGILVVGPSTILINYVDSLGLPSWTVTYLYVPGTDPAGQDGQLLRIDGNGTFTMARHVESMTATTQGNGAEIAFSFFYRGSRSHYTFEVHP